MDHLVGLSGSPVLVEGKLADQEHLMDKLCLKLNEIAVWHLGVKQQLCHRHLGAEKAAQPQLCSLLPENGTQRQSLHVELTVFSDLAVCHRGC